MHTNQNGQRKNGRIARLARMGHVIHGIFHGTAAHRSTQIVLVYAAPIRLVVVTFPIIESSPPTGIALLEVSFLPFVPMLGPIVNQPFASWARPFQDLQAHFIGIPRLAIVMSCFALPVAFRHRSLQSTHDLLLRKNGAPVP